MPIFRNGFDPQLLQVSSRGLQETQAERSMERQFRYMAARFDFVAELFVYALEAYSAAGLLFAAAFVFRVQRVDSEAQGSGIGFRLLILPGVAALWPLLLSRWLRHSTEPPLEKNSHRLAVNKS